MHSYHDPNLLSDLLEAVEDRDTGDTVYLAQRVQTHRVEVLLASYLGILDDGRRRVVHNHHRMVALDNTWGKHKYLHCTLQVL